MSNTAKLTRDDFQFVTEKRDVEIITRPSISYWSNVFRKLKSNKVVIFCLIYIAAVVLMSIFAPMFSKYSYETTNLLEANRNPGGEHIFGTDQVGRDLWTRIWVGGRVSLLIGLFGAIVPELIGITLGGIAGYFGGWVDMLIMRIIDIGVCIPSLVIITMLMLLMGGGPGTIILALALTGWMGAARNVRGRVLQFKNREFVLVARTLGARPAHVIFRSILPNVMGQLVIGVFNAIPQAIFYEAYLSFIGMGVQSPMTSWGQLSQTGAVMYRIYPYQLLIPGVVISVTVLIMYIFGNCLRDALDPKLEN